MNDQLYRYLDRSDKSYSRFMAFIYLINIVTSLSIWIPGILDNFKPSFLLEIDDIHVAVAMMYMTMNVILLHQILRHRDEHRRSYLLICYSVLTAVDIATEQIIVMFVLREALNRTRFFSRANVYYISMNMIIIAIYLTRYLFLKRKYSMSTTGRM